jgi:2-dehydro-3-deoxygalactonokinase
MPKFLSCDWGTSSFRLKLVDGENLQVITEANSNIGISTTYSSWCETENPDPEGRTVFYLKVIREHIEKLERSTNSSLDGIPLIISGMASSSIGMKELPYRQLPFKIDGSDAGVEYFEVNTSFRNPVLLISGIKSKDDVLRGEETQLVGSVTEQQDVPDDSIFIFPGTHSKHITVKGNAVTGFKTYMTGEFFEVLSNKSILKGGLEKNDDFQNLTCQKSFKQGVRDAVGSNLLNAAFRARTNSLFGKLTKKENYTYLSGLLIGTELQEITHKRSVKIYLCCASNLKHWYEAAIQVLELSDKVHIFPAQWADEAIVRGQFRIYNQFINK